MELINEERRVRLDRGRGPMIEGVVRVRGVHATRTFDFGPVQTHDGIRVESHVPTSVVVHENGIERTHDIPGLRAGPPIAAFVIAPAIALLAGMIVRRKGR